MARPETDEEKCSADWEYTEEKGVKAWRCPVVSGDTVKRVAYVPDLHAQNAYDVED